MTLSENISLVREPHRLNEGALSEYLGKNLPGFSGTLEVRQFGYGQSNPTFLLVAGLFRLAAGFRKNRGGNPFKEKLMEKLLMPIRSVRRVS